MNETQHLKRLIEKRSITNLYCLHMPKSGGTFCRNVLDRIGQTKPLDRNNWRFEHTYFSKKFAKYSECAGYQPDYMDLKAGKYYNGYITKKELKRFLVFAVVRNPFDLLVSHFSYRGERPLTEQNVPVGWGLANQKHKISSFEEYIRKFSDSKYEWFSPAFKRFMYFPMYDDDGTCCVDAVLFVENLDAGMRKLVNLFGCKDIPRLSQTNKRINLDRNRDYKSYYNDETRKLVEQKCKLELSMFGYTFDGGNEEREILIPSDRINVPSAIIVGE